MSHGNHSRPVRGYERPRQGERQEQRTRVLGAAGPRGLFASLSPGGRRPKVTAAYTAPPAQPATPVSAALPGPGLPVCGCRATSTDSNIPRVMNSSRKVPVLSPNSVRTRRVGRTAQPRRTSRCSGEPNRPPRAVVDSSGGATPCIPPGHPRTDPDRGRGRLRHRRRRQARGLGRSCRACAVEAPTAGTTRPPPVTTGSLLSSSV
ncbi:MAG: hypothetical protein ACI9CA_000951 [Natronomonas sp.]